LTALIADRPLMSHTTSKPTTMINSGNVFA